MDVRVLCGLHLLRILMIIASFMLVRHPQVMGKLRQEISDLDTGGDAIHRNHLRGLQYLQNVLKESMKATSSTRPCDVILTVAT